MWQLFSILQKYLHFFKCHTVYDIIYTKIIISIDTKIKYSLFAPQESFSTNTLCLHPRKALVHTVPACFSTQK